MVTAISRYGAKRWICALFGKSLQESQVEKNLKPSTSCTAKNSRITPAISTITISPDDGFPFIEFHKLVHVLQNTFLTLPRFSHTGVTTTYSMIAAIVDGSQWPYRSRRLQPRKSKSSVRCYATSCKVTRYFPRSTCVSCLVKSGLGRQWQAVALRSWRKPFWKRKSPVCRLGLILNPGVPTGNRTPATAVKGRCSNR